MVLFNLAIIGGLGYIASKKLRQKNKVTQIGSIQIVDQYQQKETTHHTEPALQDIQDAKHYLSVSSISVGLSLLSVAAHAPILGTLTIPFSVYSLVPPLYKTGYFISNKKIITPVAITTALSLGFLYSHYYFTAAFINWNYHYFSLTKRRFAYFENHVGESPYEFSLFLSQLINYPPSFFWVKGEDDVEIKTARTELEKGALVIFIEREFIPFIGRVVEGDASAMNWFSPQERRPHPITSGDDISPHTFILSGRVIVEFDSF